MFEITKDWIMEHRTVKGAWTGPQFAAIGLNISTKRKGWISRVVGKKITESNKRLFESRITTTQQRQLKKRADKINKKVDQPRTFEENVQLAMQRYAERHGGQSDGRI